MLDVTLLSAEGGVNMFMFEYVYVYVYLSRGHGTCCVVDAKLQAISYVPRCVERMINCSERPWSGIFAHEGNVIRRFRLGDFSEVVEYFRVASNMKPRTGLTRTQRVQRERT